MPQDTDQLFFDALAAGATVVAAAETAGVYVSDINVRRNRDSQFDDLVCEILRATGRKEAVPLRTRQGKMGRPETLTPQARRTVVGVIGSGGTLQEAADAAQVTRLAIKRARYRDTAFDAEVVRAGGGRFKGLVKPPCPGPRCGTVYGYDTLACRETACKEAKAVR